LLDLNLRIQAIHYEGVVAQPTNDQAKAEEIKDHEIDESVPLAASIARTAATAQAWPLAVQSVLLIFIIGFIFRIRIRVIVFLISLLFLWQTLEVACPVSELWMALRFRALQSKEGSPKDDNLESQSSGFRIHLETRCGPTSRTGQRVISPEDDAPVVLDVLDDQFNQTIGQEEADRFESGDEKDQLILIW
jgi:hypothetical protein